MTRFFIFFPFFVAFIMGLNIWDDIAAGRPFNWENIVYPIGMMLWGGVVYVCSRLIFKFVLGYVSHEEKQK